MRRRTVDVQPDENGVPAGAMRSPTPLQYHLCYMLATLVAGRSRTWYSRANTDGGRLVGIWREPQATQTRALLVPARVGEALRSGAANHLPLRKRAVGAVRAHRPRVSGGFRSRPARARQSRRVAEEKQQE